LPSLAAAHRHHEPLHHFVSWRGAAADVSTQPSDLGRACQPSPTTKNSMDRLFCRRQIRSRYGKRSVIPSLPEHVRS
jgi:hypothetical protein